MTNRAKHASMANTAMLRSIAVDPKYYMGEEGEFDVLRTLILSYRRSFPSTTSLYVSVFRSLCANLTACAAFLNLLTHQDGGKSHQAGNIIDWPGCSRQYPL